MFMSLVYPDASSIRHAHSYSHVRSLALATAVLLTYTGRSMAHSGVLLTLKQGREDGPEAELVRVLMALPPPGKGNKATSGALDPASAVPPPSGWQFEGNLVLSGPMPDDGALQAAATAMQRLLTEGKKAEALKVCADGKPVAAFTMHNISSSHTRCQVCLSHVSACHSSI